MGEFVVALKVDGEGDVVGFGEGVEAAPEEELVGVGDGGQFEEGELEF